MVWCEGHGCGSTYRVVRLSCKSNFSAKRSKNTFLTLKWPFLGQPDNPKGWTTSMLFLTICHIFIGINPWKFCTKKSFSTNLKIWHFTKPPIFNSKLLFLLHPIENQTQMMGWHRWNSNLIITMVSSQELGVPIIMKNSVSK